MNNVEQRRDDIDNYFQSNDSCRKYFLEPAHEEEFVAHYNSMYLLQDSTESLWLHRRRGFSSKPLLAYLEFWGAMQAVIIQQDSISEIYAVMVGTRLDAKARGLKAWLEIRELRNICAGHPAMKDKPKSTGLTRSFMGRSFGSYDEITYERWQSGKQGQSKGTRSHPRVQLGKLLDRYSIEAERQLANVLAAMKRRWP